MTSRQASENKGAAQGDPVDGKGMAATYNPLER